MSQHDEEMEPIIPVEQDLVPFEQTTLLGVRLPDNRVATLFSLLCERLHLDRSSQARRIKADPAIADCLIPARIETPGGPQVLNVLIAGAIPKWLSGIRLGKVAPELRPVLLALQREAADVLYRHFFKVQPEQSAPPSPQPPVPEARSPWELVYRGLRGIQAEQQDMGERLAALERQQEVVEEVQAALGEHLVETNERLACVEQHGEDPLTRQAGLSHAPSSSPRLSPEHLVQVYVLAHAARRQRGEQISALLQDLADALGVADISDLPDEAWRQAIRWFWQQSHH